MKVIAFTVDQRRSRTNVDRVPHALNLLHALSWIAAPVRTAGDEFQALTVDPSTVATAISALLRDGQWSIGIGIGDAQMPQNVPAPDAREATGPALICAREAVMQAKRSPRRICVVGADTYAGRRIENAAWLLGLILDARSDKGWEVFDMAATGLSFDQIANSLSISGSAVSQRAQSALLVEGERALELVQDAADLALSRLTT